MGSIASISGVALVPGVSRNRRLYTPELIQKAAERMQKRLSDPNGLPIVMRTHHEAGDDSAKIVGRVTSVKVDNNKALRYKADLYDTFHAREIANLVTPDAPALRSVSIHGYWIGDPRQVNFEGSPAQTADDLEIDAIDFTASPGVDGALIDGGGAPTETVGGRTPISESMEANVTLVEEGSGWSMMRGRQYELDEAKYSADDMKALLSKGHAMKNASGQPSYPIADLSDLKKAIRAVGRGKSSHDAIRRHIIKRAKALGASDLIPDNWSSGGSNKETQNYRLGLVTEYWPEGPANPSGFCIDAYSGPLSVTVRGSVSPDELRAAAKLAVCAAMDAICVMDPDDDADIDPFGNDDDMTSEEGGPMANADYGPDDDDKMGPKNEAAPVTGINRGGAGKSPDKGAEDGTDEAAAVLGINRNKSVKKAIRKAVQKEMAKMMRDKPKDGDGDESYAQVAARLYEKYESYTVNDWRRYFAEEEEVSPSETMENVSATTKESAVSDTQKAAEAAPSRMLTEEDVKTIGGLLAEAVRAIGEQKDPKHAAATQENTEKATEAVAESTTPKADDLVALKESLAKELRKEIRDELRAELLEEKGLPPRRGYRLNENAEEEVQLTDAELFDKHRVEMLLGAYAATPSPDAQAV